MNFGMVTEQAEPARTLRDRPCRCMHSPLCHVMSLKTTALRRGRTSNVASAGVVSEEIDAADSRADALRARRTLS